MTITTVLPVANKMQDFCNRQIVDKKDMKGKILFTFLLLLTAAAFAQDQKHAITLQVNSVPERNPNNYNPFGNYWDERKDLYEGPNIQTRDKSFSTGLMYYHCWKEGMVLRARAGVNRTVIRSDWGFSDPAFAHSYEASKQQTDIYFAPGITKMFTVMRFAYFAGVEMPVTLYGPAKVRKSYSYSDVSTGELKYTFETTGSYRNGWSAGVGAFGGFSARFYKTITFGPEVGFAFLYSDYGSSGEFDSTTQNGSTHSDHSTFSRSYRKFGVSGITGSLNLSYWF
jgi:hypothetical protein